MKINEVRILGSGTSTGIPTIGCQCRVCQSDFPKDQRLRSSLFLKTKNNNHIIVDTGPDLRTQILREKITHCDAVIITHEHADHIHGLDDLKPFRFDSEEYLPIYTHPKCKDFLEKKFSYIFDTKNYFSGKTPLGSGVPKLKLEEVNEELNLAGDQFKFTLLPHGHTQSLSFYHDNFAYIIDCNKVTDDWISFLKNKNLKILIIDCVRRQPHSTHLNLEMALKYAREINAENTYLTHLTHEFMHEELLEELKLEKINIEPAYDGQILKY